MRSPTCESVVDDEDLRSREQSTLLRDSKQKSDPPPPHYKNKKPPSVHSDSGYSSKTGLTSGSAGSRPSAGARPSAKSHQPRPESRPPPSGALARVRSAHTTAPPSHPSAPPFPGSGHAYASALPPRSASAAPQDQRFILPNRPPPQSTTRSQQHPPPPPLLQTHTPYYPPYHHYQQHPPPPPPPPPLVSPIHPPSASYSSSAPMPAAPPPSSYQYQQPLPLPPPPQPPYPQRPPQRSSSMSQRRPSSIHVATAPNGYPFPGAVPPPSSAYGVASPGPSVHTPISPSTPTFWTPEGTFTWEGPGPPPSAPGRPLPSRRVSVSSNSRPASWYEMPPGALGPASSSSTVVVDHSRRRSAQISHDAIEQYRDQMEDSRRMPPPTSRAQSTRPQQQTLDVAYRGGPPARPQVGRKSKSTTYHPNADEPVHQVSRERPRQYSEGNVPQTASRKLQKNTQNAEAYMQEQAGKTSLQLTDDELQKRRLKEAPPKRTTSKSHRSRAPSQSTSRSMTESERERQSMRVSIDASGVSISGDTEGRPLDISVGDDGQHYVTIGSPSKSRQKRYITEGSTQSRVSKQSFADRSRKRDSVVDAGDVDNTRAIVRTDSGSS